MTVTSGATSQVIAGDPPAVVPLAYDLRSLGYVEEEYELQGDAVCFRLVSDPTEDGCWDAEPDDTAGYRTRLLVRRPADESRFSGTVLVEWLNVSGGFDAAPEWSFLHRRLVRRGDAWVGVSAQRVGIHGGGLFPGAFTLLFGTTAELDEQSLAARYPAGRDDYLEQFAAALDETIAAGFLLTDDRPEILSIASSAPLEMSR
jgi:hypothetical protein